MERALDLLLRVSAAMASALICAVVIMPLCASERRGKLSGTILDQAGKPRRGTKIQLAVNNLANSHNLVGVTPALAATAAAPYVQNPGDLLNLMPGRSVTLTITGGWAPRR